MCLCSKGICTGFYINLNSRKQTYPWGIKVNGKVFLKEIIFEARSEWWEQFIKVKREKTSIGLGQKVCSGFSVIAYKKKKKNTSTNLLFSKYLRYMNIPGKRKHDGF